jgi:hypothetical protein
MRFSIRDVLWAMAVAAVAIGWWIESWDIRQLKADSEKRFDYF